MQVGDLSGRAVARQDDLAVAVEQGVEGVEELFLGTILAGEELDVIDQQGVRLAEAPAELHQLSVLDGRNELVGELLGGHINDLGALLLLHDAVADGMQEVGFTQPDGAMDEEGVVGPRGGVGHGLGGRMGELAVHPGDKGFKGIAADELPGERLGLLFPFGLEKLVFGGRHRAVLGADDLKADLNLPAHGQSGTLPQLVEVVLLDPILVNGVFDAENQATGVVTQGEDRREPAVQGVGGNDLFKLAAYFDPYFRGIVHALYVSIIFFRGGGA